MIKDKKPAVFSSSDRPKITRITPKIRATHFPQPSSSVQAKKEPILDDKNSKV